MRGISNRLIRWAACAASAASIGVVAAPVAAQAQVRTFNIPAQALGPALLEFSRQSDVMILVASELTAGRQSRAVTGALPISEAIARLLGGSGLRAVPNPSGGYRIERSRPGPADREPGPPGEPGMGGATAEAEEADILVIGTNIRGIRNPTAPVTILDRDYIESTGYSTTTRLIESLPQNFALASQSAPTGFPGVSGDRSQGSAVNLRGIGEGTTLVLLNGRRLPLGFFGSAVDISTLPLTAVDRVEVLTDGASALYGADAVGGVVNFVLRRDYDGAEVRLRTGWAPGGLNEHRASLTGGMDWGSGSALLSGEYYHRDLLAASDRDFLPANVPIGSLLPRDDTYSLVASAHQDLTDSLSLSADALYTHRDTFNRGGRFTPLFAEDADNSIDQLSANAGLALQIGSGWRVELTGGYGLYDLDSLRGGFVGGAKGEGETQFESWLGDLRSDGPLFELPGGTVRAALGASYRAESFELLNTVSGFVTNRIDESQDIVGLYAEVLVPLFGRDNAAQGLRRLELSLAARYDHYSNFGSSVDPRVGLAWEPVEGLLLRGSYGTSYVAPKLSDYDTSNASAAALFDLDPGAPFGFSYMLQVAGGADVPSLRPQESRNITAGIEIAPVAAPGLRIALGYYDIRYREQIAAPPQSASVLLGNPEAFGSLFIRNPTVQQVQDYIAISQAGLGFFPFDAFFQFDPNFDPASVEVIVDFRRRNLALVQTRGLDFLVNYDFETGGSNFHLGLNGVYIFERTQQVTSTSAAFETVDTVFNPPELRMRASAGWRRGGWSVNAFGNYVDGYTDNRVAPFLTIGSWITFDAHVAYRFGEGRGALSGVTVALSATNLFDRDPRPVRVNSPFDIGFDPANASPLGRLVAIEISKSW